MEPRILLWAGLGLLIIGSALHWSADNLARNYLRRNAQRTTWTSDAVKKERIGYIGERRSLLGGGLLVVGAFGWMNSKKETPE